MNSFGLQQLFDRTGGFLLGKMVTKEAEHQR
jgi:hypothetical protein